MPHNPPRKKLIEVALPLDRINAAAAREKSIRHGHPSTLHLWWARRPLAAARAVIFAQMVDDPGSWPELFPTEEAQEAERQRLFRIIESIVPWESTTKEELLEPAREEIRKSWRRTCQDNKDHPRAKELFDPDKLPPFHDPFAGGGSLPLEAQRLGLEAHASDLNPVAVLINKAMIEIPPRFAGRPPVNPEARARGPLAKTDWRGAEGLAEDVRHYGKWMRDEAEKRIGWLYPKVEVTAEMAKARPDLKGLVGRSLTVIAWLWARTVNSPNPAFREVDVPLASTFMLSTKAGKEAWVDPVVEEGGYRFEVRVGKPADAAAAKAGTKLARGANFRCVMSGAPIAGDYIKAEGKAGRMGARLMAIVAEGERGRVYLAPTVAHEALAREARPAWRPDSALPNDPRNFWTVDYGLTTFGDLFTPRQLVALTTFSDLVQEARARVERDAVAAGLPDDGTGLEAGGVGARGYAEAVGVYLACVLSAVADDLSSIVTWRSGHGTGATRSTFARQALPMVWDFAEANAFAGAAGDVNTATEAVARVIENAPVLAAGRATQADAARGSHGADIVFSSDPPYYDNIGYADLSDFFYVWLRRSLRAVCPGILSTLAVPKVEELVATPYRHGSKKEAEEFFLGGMTEAMRRLAEQAHLACPVTVYYAFKQAETEEGAGIASTGWETFLGAVMAAGFAITGTWPMRTERGGRSIGIGANALASSIILVCRPRLADAPSATRKDFVAALKAELPAALLHLQRSNIAPVDLAQAAIGPGMAVYTRHGKVLDAKGEPVSVREALALINATLDEVLSEQEGDFDADTRWAVAWYEEAGFEMGDFGRAEQLSKSKNTSVDGMKEAGILDGKAPGGKARLLPPRELPATWDPGKDPRLTAWEVVHHLIRVLESGGESAAADLVARLGAKGDVARELAYRLYVVAERKKRSADALAYNGLVQSWEGILDLSRGGSGREKQIEMFPGEEEG